jgi:hypothetical protein
MVADMPMTSKQLKRNDAKFFNDLDDTAFSANVVA